MRRGPGRGTRGESMALPIEIKIKSIETRFQNLRLRMPFKFGIATLTDTPLMIMKMVAEDNAGRTAIGYSSDVLPALWFDKAPGKTIEQKVDDQIEIARRASERYLAEGGSAATPFDRWLKHYGEIKAEAAAIHINPLTAGFGSSFCERAMIDAACRLAGISFFEGLRANIFGIEPARVHAELGGLDWNAAIPSRPLDKIYCRHTVGLADPLRVSEIAPEDRVTDGLPQALEEDIRAYGLRYFKIKIDADRERNLARLTAMAEIFAKLCAPGYRTTLDGNEQVKNLDDLAWLLAKLGEKPETRALLESVLFIEQPLSRDAALGPAVAPGIREAAKMRPLIIDESDDDLNSLPLARETGYAGISCKNCKGVMKAVLNKCLIESWRAKDAKAGWILSSEDLTNTGIIPLQEDFATCAALGIDHSERNGHHYFRGLDHLTAKERASALAAHGDLYAEQGGLAALKIKDGAIAVKSIQCPGFGYASETDFEGRMTAEEWRKTS